MTVYYLQTTITPPGPCRKCGSPVVKTECGWNACVYCEPEMFPRPKMSAAADTNAPFSTCVVQNADLRWQVLVNGQPVGKPLIGVNAATHVSGWLYCLGPELATRLLTPMSAAADIA